MLKEDLETGVLKVMLNFRHNSKELLLMGTNKVLIEGVKDDMSKVNLNFRQNFDESPMRTNNKVAPEAEGIQGVAW